MVLGMNVKCGYVSRCPILHDSNFRIRGLGYKGSKKGTWILKYDMIIEKASKNKFEVKISF